jgi:hypothetical protein
VRRCAPLAVLEGAQRRTRAPADARHDLGRRQGWYEVDDALRFGDDVMFSTDDRSGFAYLQS